MKFNKALIKDIGFDIIQNKLSESAFFYTNKQYFSDLKPLSDKNKIIESQNQTNEIYNSFKQKQYITPYKIDCITKTLDSLKINGNILEKEEFQNLKLIFEFSIDLKNDPINKLYLKFS